MPSRSWFWLACFASLLIALVALPSVASSEPPVSLPGTAVLSESRPLDEVMVAGIDKFALRALQQVATEGSAGLDVDHTSLEGYETSLQPYREVFAKRIGVVDPRVKADGFHLLATTRQPALVAQNDRYSIYAVSWPTLDGVDGEGLLLRPQQKAIARIVAIPDADWTPEMVAGLQPSPASFAADLAAFGCEVLVPTLISRDAQFSGNPEINRATNLPHREFIYRQAFELGRHVIGYEVQKMLAGVDQFELLSEDDDLPIGVVGVGEGGLLALYSGALDPRIDFTIVSGYFDQRTKVWQEPIYRNVWHLLPEFGDAELASMIAPRSLFIEVAPAIPTVTAAPPSQGRSIAAPGRIEPLDPESVMVEVRHAETLWQQLADTQHADTSGNSAQTLGQFGHSTSQSHGQPPLSAKMLWSLLTEFTAAEGPPPKSAGVLEDRRTNFSADERQRRQVAQLTDFTQRLLRRSHRERDRRFRSLDHSSVDAFVKSAGPLRQWVYEELIGKLPLPSMPANPRSRQVMLTEDFTGYEVVLDVYSDVIAAGILLLPNDLRPDEMRPVVVCQHGLEGTPEQTVGGPETEMYRAYKGFAAELARRGFIVYAPQNPYRGQDAFRTLQRKSNPLGRSLFSYIIPQHLVTLRWLSQMPGVDPDRIGFYGLSYGGKTAMRVPPMLPPGDGEPGYCLSICSADFNDWVAKNASTDAAFSYIWTGEYEIFEWNMGHVANYAELAMLMTPRPFMVERGHDDGVGIDEWVAWEYAKVRRHYNKLGIGDRTEIEFFDGPHTINGQGTYDFLHRHLNWPKTDPAP